MHRLQESELLHDEEQAEASRTRRDAKVLPTLQWAPRPQGDEVVVGLVAVVQRTNTFLQHVRGEMRKVSWPTWDDLRRSTLVITVFVAILGVIIGVMDSAFSLILITWLGQAFG